MTRGKTPAIKMISMAMLVAAGLPLTACAVESPAYASSPYYDESGYDYPPAYGVFGFDFEGGDCCGDRFHDFHDGHHDFHDGGHHGFGAGGGFAHTGGGFGGHGGFGGGHGGGGHGR